MSFKFLQIIYRNKNGKNDEEVCKTNLYHKSFGINIMCITIPCLRLLIGVFMTKIDFTPPIFPYIHEIKIINNIELKMGTTLRRLLKLIYITDALVSLLYA